MKRMMFLTSAASAISIGGLVNARDLTKRTPLRAREQQSVASAASALPWMCSSAVVWVDAPTGTYYHKGDRNYGRTQTGAYTCEDKAIEAGHLAANRAIS